MRTSDKERLGRLANDLELARGRATTQQDALGRVIDFAIRNRDAFLADAGWKPLNEAEIAAWDRRVRDLKGWKAVPPDEVDDVVYGA